GGRWTSAPTSCSLPRSRTIQGGYSGEDEYHSVCQKVLGSSSATLPIAPSSPTISSESAASGVGTICDPAHSPRTRIAAEELTLWIRRPRSTRASPDTPRFSRSRWKVTLLPGASAPTSRGQSPWSAHPSGAEGSMVIFFVRLPPALVSVPAAVPLSATPIPVGPSAASSVSAGPVQ